MGNGYGNKWRDVYEHICFQDWVLGAEIAFDSFPHREEEEGLKNDQTDPTCFQRNQKVPTIRIPWSGQLVMRRVLRSVAPHGGMLAIVLLHAM